MRFYCQSCNESMDESLVDQRELRSYKMNRDRLDIHCPFCHHISLSVVMP